MYTVTLRKQGLDAVWSQIRFTGVLYGISLLSLFNRSLFVTETRQYTRISIAIPIVLHRNRQLSRFGSHVGDITKADRKDSSCSPKAGLHTFRRSFCSLKMNFLKAVLFDNDDNEEETDEESSKLVEKGDEKAVAEDVNAEGPEDSADGKEEGTVDDEVAVRRVRWGRLVGRVRTF